MRHNTDILNLPTPACSRVDLTYLALLMDKLEPHLTYHTCPVGKRFNFSANNQPDCYLIRKGVISVCRQPHDILVDIFEAPTLKGIIPVHHTSQSLYTLQILESAEIAILDKERFYSLLTEHNLWEPFSRHLQLVVSMAAEIVIKLASPSVFEQVRYQLYELMSKPQTLRESITAENYIRSKTRLSRSSVMNTLSALKTGGYIRIESGHLIDIKCIPAHF